jgi:hypothetical protein
MFRLALQHKNHPVNVRGAKRVGNLNRTLGLLTEADFSDILRATMVVPLISCDDKYLARRLL